MMKLGLCCGSGLCCALLSGVLWFSGSGVVFGEAIDAQKQETTTAPCGMPSADVTDLDLTSDEQRVVAYLADMIEAGKPPMASSVELEQEVGLSLAAVEQLDKSKFRAGVVAELSRRGFDLAGLFGNCSKYSACSVDRNLMNATGDELARYEAEVAQDGAVFSDRRAPDFTLPTTKGEQVSLSDQRGKNVAVVFLSAHCHHSLDTLPILAELKRKYADRGLEILPVFINSGDIEDVASRAWELDVEYPLLVSEGKEISKSYDSRMVPSTFLIDERGNLVKQLVGFKDQAELDRAFEELVGT
jgi:peroxiredoxin